MLFFPKNRNQEEQKGANQIEEKTLWNQAKNITDL
jgi:hypothetical protein